MTETKDKIMVASMVILAIIGTYLWAMTVSGALAILGVWSFGPEDIYNETPSAIAALMGMCVVSLYVTKRILTG